MASARSLFLGFFYPQRLAPVLLKIRSISFSQGLGRLVMLLTPGSWRGAQLLLPSIVKSLGNLRVIGTEGSIGFKLQGLVNDPRRNIPVDDGRDPFEALDDLMAVIEALCPVWPQRETFTATGNFYCEISRIDLDS